MDNSFSSISDYNLAQELRNSFAVDPLHIKLK